MPARRHFLPVYTSTVMGARGWAWDGVVCARQDASGEVGSCQTLGLWRGLTRAREAPVSEATVSRVPAARVGPRPRPLLWGVRGGFLNARRSRSHLSNASIVRRRMLYRSGYSSNLHLISAAKSGDHGPIIGRRHQIDPPRRGSLVVCAPAYHTHSRAARLIRRTRISK